MELQIRTKNFELTQSVRGYVERKVGRIGRHLPAASRVLVDLSSEHVRSQGQRVVAQLTLDINGVVLRGEERGHNVTAALDAAVDLLDRRIDRYKGKSYRVEQTKRAVRRGQGLPDQLGEADAPGAAEAEEESSPRAAVVKSKSFPIKPMAVDEAIFQMEMLGHDFFLFLNSEVGVYNVLYRRRDNAYGLIQPEPL